MLRQCDDQRLPPLPVVAIKRLGNRLVGAGAVLEQLRGAPAEQIVGAEDQPEALVFGVAVGKIKDVPALVNLPGVADGVKTYLQHVGEQHPLAVPGVVGVFPGLLHRAFMAAGHDGVEILRVTALEFDRGDNTPVLAGEIAKRGIGAAGAGLLLFMHRPLHAALAKWLVAKQFNEELADEWAANRGFFLLVKAAIADGRRPVVQDFLVRGRRRLGGYPLLQQ